MLQVQSRPVHPKVLLPQRTLGSDSPIATRTKGKVQVTEQRKRCPGAGKENGLETMTTRKNSLARGKVSEVKAQVQKATKERNPVKKHVGKHVCLKVLIFIINVFCFFSLCLKLPKPTKCLVSLTLYPSTS